MQYFYLQKKEKIFFLKKLFNFANAMVWLILNIKILILIFIS